MSIADAEALSKDEKAVDAVSGATLVDTCLLYTSVIIDPIQAYLGADVDMNRANEVRTIFMRLGQVAQRTGCAILLIGHLNKAAGMQSLQPVSYTHLDVYKRQL